MYDNVCLLKNEVFFCKYFTRKIEIFFFLVRKWIFLHIFLEISRPQKINVFRHRISTQVPENWQKSPASIIFHCYNMCKFFEVVVVEPVEVGSEVVTHPVYAEIPLTQQIYKANST